MEYTKEVRFNTRGANARHLNEFLVELGKKTGGVYEAFKIKIDEDDLVFYFKTDSKYQEDQLDSLLTRREFSILVDIQR